MARPHLVCAHLAMVLAACDGGAATDTTVPGVETTVGVASTAPRTTTPSCVPTTPRPTTQSRGPTTPSTDVTGAKQLTTPVRNCLNWCLIPVETIVDVAAGTGRFATLLSAIEATGLTEELAGAGPFTLFAPTDDAFAELPDGTLEELLADPAQL